MFSSFCRGLWVRGFHDSFWVSCLHEAYTRKRLQSTICTGPDSVRLPFFQPPSPVKKCFCKDFLLLFSGTFPCPEKVQNILVRAGIDSRVVGHIFGHCEAKMHRWLLCSTSFLRDTWCTCLHPVPLQLCRARARITWDLSFLHDSKQFPETALSAVRRHVHRVRHRPRAPIYMFSIPVLHLRLYPSERSRCCLLLLSVFISVFSKQLCWRKRRCVFLTIKSFSPSSSSKQINLGKGEFRPAGRSLWSTHSSDETPYVPKSLIGCPFLREVSRHMSADNVYNEFRGIPTSWTSRNLSSLYERPPQKHFH